MNKKGQGLPMNVVIMAIIVIVVLVLVVTFFFGGFSGLTLKIREVFFGGMVGTSETLAVQACERFCDNLKLRSYEDVPGLVEVAAGSMYCKLRPVDLNGDGQITGDEQEVSCRNDLHVYCRNIPTKAGIHSDLVC